ncbi:Trm112 family protein [Streptomyces xanthophaeus]|uniref:Trm112 family protein n=1 Tax=Streptomyces xanthophaeus TaxID=67385 RepID=UPI00371068CA
MPLEAGLLEILACPACHAPLEDKSAGGHLPAVAGGETAPELICTGQDCGLAYPVRDGIPVLLVDEARRPA